MEKQDRAVKVLLIVAGFALVLCVGMVIGGALVYGALRIGDVVTSRSEQQEPQVSPEEVYEEAIRPTFATGALLTQVLPGTPAEEAGLQVGDLIVAVDGQQVGPDGTLAELIGQHEPGDRLTLEVQGEEGASRILRVTLAESPNAAGEPYLGVYFQPTTMREVPLQEMLPFSDEGAWQLDELPMPGLFGGARIMVMSVAEGSPAAEAGLQHGDLITSLDGELLADAAALTEAIADHNPGDRITLGVLHVADEAEVELRIRLGERPERAGEAYLGVTISDLYRHFRFQGGSGGVDLTPPPPLP